MPRPVVTIGIPMYNAEKTIGLCLKSILNSDYDMNKIEIIIVDNFSKDNSVKVARNILSLSNVNYVILSYKGSVGFLRQIIVNNAKGKYIIWIDSDAVIRKDFIRRQVEFAEKNDVKLGAVLPIILPYNADSSLARGIGYMWSLSTVRALLKKKTPFLGILGALTPVKTIKEIGGFNIKLQSGEDIDLFYRMQRLGYKIYVNPYAKIYHIMPTKLGQIVTRAYRLSYYYSSKSSYLILQNTFDFIAAIFRMFYCFKKFNDYACATLPLISVIEGIAKYLAAYFK
jgi:glycosyltransferase involved in cell wall biosynthesis